MEQNLRAITITNNQHHLSPTPTTITTMATRTARSLTHFVIRRIRNQNPRHARIFRQLHARITAALFSLALLVLAGGLIAGVNFSSISAGDLKAELNQAELAALNAKVNAAVTAYNAAAAKVGATQISPLGGAASINRPTVNQVSVGGNNGVTTATVNDAASVEASRQSAGPKSESSISAFTTRARDAYHTCLENEPDCTYARSAAYDECWNDPDTKADYCDELYSPELERVASGSTYDNYPHTKRNFYTVECVERANCTAEQSALYKSEARKECMMDGKTDDCSEYEPEAQSSGGSLSAAGSGTPARAYTTVNNVDQYSNHGCAADETFNEETWGCEPAYSVPDSLFGDL